MRSNTSRIAFCGMIAALSVVVMFLTGIVPIATFAVPAIAGCFLIAIVAETGIRYGFAVYVIVSILSAILVPDREAVLLYVIFFGYYPTLYGALGRVRSKPLCWVVKLAVFNAAMVAESVLAIFLLRIPMEEMIPFGWITIPIMLILLNIMFVLYDLSMNGLIVMYIRRLHPIVGKYLR